MGYAPITDAETAAGRPVTATLLARLRDNPRYIAEGDPNAPKIANAAFTNGTIDGVNVDVDSLDGVKLAADSVTEAKIANGHIHLAQLALGIDLLSVTLTGLAYTKGNTSSSNYKYLFGIGARLVGNAARWIPPDQRKFWCDMGSVDFAFSNAAVASFVSASLNSEVNGDVCEVAIFYLSSSPPYDLGNGEAGLFTFIRRNEAGEILSVMCCDSPPWSSINDGHRRKQGGRHYVRPFMPISQDDLKNHGKRNALLAKIRSGKGLPDEFEVTPLNKCRNKDIMPHPFLGLGPGEYVELINPASEIAHDMARLKKAKAPVANYVSKGLIVTEPDPSAQEFMPAGVRAVSAYFTNDPEEDAA